MFHTTDYDLAMSADDTLEEFKRFRRMAWFFVFWALMFDPVLETKDSSILYLLTVDLYSWIFDKSIWDTKHTLALIQGVPVLILEFMMTVAAAFATIGCDKYRQLNWKIFEKVPDHERESAHWKEIKKYEKVNFWHIVTGMYIPAAIVVMDWTPFSYFTAKYAEYVARPIGAWLGIGGL